MAQKYKVETYSDGSTILSNIRNDLGIPVLGVNDNLTATKVNQWYDGTAMTDAKVDGKIYLKFKGTGDLNGSYFKVNLPNDKELFLEKDTMDQFRALSSVEILLLKMGYYKGVRLNGYYTKGDTPAPIEYYLSDTTESDDGGSVIEINGVKFEHVFLKEVDVFYFGVKSDNLTDNFQVFTKVSDYARAKGLDIVVSNNGLDIIVNGSVSIYNNVIGRGSNPKLKSSLSFARLLNLKSSNITIDGLTIEFTNTVTSTNAPIAIEFRECSNINIINCAILNARIACASTNNTVANNIVVRNCTVNADLTPYDRYQIQNDVFYFIGVRNVEISGCVITCKNVNRVFKFSDFEDNPNSVIGDISIFNNVMTSVTDSTKQFIDCYQHTHNFKMYNNTIETYGHNSVFENKTTMVHMYNRDTFIYNNVYKGDGTFARSYGVYASNMGRDIGGLDNISIYNNVIEKTNNAQNALNFMAYHSVSITGNTIKGVDKDSPWFRIGNIKDCQILNNTFINGSGVIVSDNTIDAATYTPQLDKLVIRGNVIEGEVGSANTALIRISNHINIRYFEYSNNFLNHTDISTFSSRPLVFLGTVSVTMLNVRNNDFNGANSPLLGSAIVDTYRMYDNSWASYNYQSPAYSRTAISETSTITPQTQSQLFEVVGNTGDVTLTLNANDKVIVGSKKTFRNSSFFKVTILAGSGVNIGGTLTLSNNTNFITLIYTGSNTYRAVEVSTTATTNITGVVKQSAASPDTAPAPSATYTQAEVQAILAELRDLKTKLRTAGILAP